MIASLCKLVIVAILLFNSEGAEEIPPNHPLTEQENSCFRSDLQLRSRDPDGYVTWFNVSGRGDCWRYCQLTITCKALTFDTINFTCYLYHESYYPVPIEGDSDSNGNVTLEQRCTKTERGVVFDTAIEISESKGGILIMKANGYENTCMMKKKMLFDEKKEDTAFSIKFGRCYGQGRKWLIRKVGVETSSNEEAGEETSSYRHLLTFSPADTHDLCLDVKLDGHGLPIAILRNCREFSSGNLTDKQIMLVKDFWHADRINSYYILPRWSDTSLLGTGEQFEYLDGLLFQDPDNFTNIGSCHLSQFKIPNGMLENTNKVPFFLAGHSVTITCKEGYGVKKLNYNRTQTLVCLKDAKPYICTKCPNPSKKSDGLIKKRGLLAVICLVAASVLVSFPIVACSFLKTKRSDPESPDVAAGGEAAHTENRKRKEEEEVKEN